jgi:hypothetical protein
MIYHLCLGGKNRTFLFFDKFVNKTKSIKDEYGTRMTKTTQIDADFFTAKGAANLCELCGKITKTALICVFRVIRVLHKYFVRIALAKYRYYLCLCRKESISQNI